MKIVAEKFVFLEFFFISLYYKVIQPRPRHMCSVWFSESYKYVMLDVCLQNKGIII